MRILKVIHAWHPEGRGGTETHASHVARGLSARGHQVGVFARTGRPDRPEYEVTTGWDGPVGVTRVNNNFVDTPSFHWIYSNAHIHEAFERELAEFKPDLVHIHHLTGLSTTIIEAVKSRGIPLVMTLHDFWTVCPRGQRMTRELDLCADVDRNKCYTCLGGLWPHLFSTRETEPTIVDNRGRLSPRVLAEWDRHMAYVLDLCDPLIAPSAFHRERMLDFPIDPARIISLPHGLDHGPFDGRLKEPKAVERIGYIGSVIPVKGVHVLLEAFLGLDRRDLELHIHGEMPSFHDDKTYGERLKDMARGTRNVTFHGAYEPDQVPGILEDLDILVVTSLWWETFCLTIREGLLAGVPVLAADHGAMREALDGERDGLFFRTGSVEDLREKLDLLITDDALRERLMNRGDSVKPMTVYLEELEETYAEAVRLSSRREASLVVAPPTFPVEGQEADGEGRLDLASIPWDRIGVAVQQAGTASVSLSTRMPTGETPSLGVGLSIKDAGRDLGNVDLTVDLGCLGAAAPAVGGPPPSAEPPPAVEEPPPVEEPPETAPAPEEPPKRSRRRRPEPAPPPRPTAEARAAAAQEETAAPAPRSPVRSANGGGGPTPEPADESGTSGQGVRRHRAPRPRQASKRTLDGGAPRVCREELSSDGIRTERWSMRRPPVKVRKLSPS